MEMDKWLTPRTMQPLRGDERFVGVDATVSDFWRYALSDLRMNNARGYLAEFLVARAVGATSPRTEWDAYDVLSPTGVKIEVKTAGYLQAWEQRGPSTIRFSGLKSRTWNPRTGYSEAQTYNADVYVFCLQASREHQLYEPLDVDAWRFWVLPAAVVREIGAASLSLRRVQQLAGEVTHARLAAEVAQACLGTN